MNPMLKASAAIAIAFEKILDWSAMQLWAEKEDWDQIMDHNIIFAVIYT